MDFNNSGYVVGCKHAFYMECVKNWIIYKP